MTSRADSPAPRIQFEEDSPAPRDEVEFGGGKGQNGKGKGQNGKGKGQKRKGKGQHTGKGTANGYRNSGKGATNGYGNSGKGAGRGHNSGKGGAKGGRGYSNNRLRLYSDSGRSTHNNPERIARRNTVPVEYTQEDLFEGDVGQYEITINGNGNNWNGNNRRRWNGNNWNGNAWNNWDGWCDDDGLYGDDDLYDELDFEFDSHDDSAADNIRRHMQTPVVSIYLPRQTAGNLSPSSTNTGPINTAPINTGQPQTRQNQIAPSTNLGSLSLGHGALLNNTTQEPEVSLAQAFDPRTWFVNSSALREQCRVNPNLENTGAYVESVQNQLMEHSGSVPRLHEDPLLSQSGQGYSLPSPVRRLGNAIMESRRFFSPPPAPRQSSRALSGTVEGQLGPVSIQLVHTHNLLGNILGELNPKQTLPVTSRGSVLNWTSNNFACEIEKRNLHIWSELFSHFAKARLDIFYTISCTRLAILELYAVHKSNGLGEQAARNLFEDLTVEEFVHDICQICAEDYCNVLFDTFNLLSRAERWGSVLRAYFRKFNVQGVKPEETVSPLDKSSVHKVCDELVPKKGTSTSSGFARQQKKVPGWLTELSDKYNLKKSNHSAAHLRKSIRTRQRSGSTNTAERRGKVGSPNTIERRGKVGSPSTAERIVQSKDTTSLEVRHLRDRDDVFEALRNRVLQCPEWKKWHEEYEKEKADLLYAIDANYKNYTKFTLEEPKSFVNSGSCADSAQRVKVLEASERLESLNEIRKAKTDVLNVFFDLFQVADGRYKSSEINEQAEDSCSELNSAARLQKYMTLDSYRIAEENGEFEISDHREILITRLRLTEQRFRECCLRDHAIPWSPPPQLDDMELVDGVLRSFRKMQQGLNTSTINAPRTDLSRRKTISNYLSCQPVSPTDDEIFSKTLTPDELRALYDHIGEIRPCSLLQSYPKIFKPNVNELTRQYFDPSRTPFRRRSSLNSEIEKLQTFLINCSIRDGKRDIQHLGSLLGHIPREFFEWAILGSHSQYGSSYIGTTKGGLNLNRSISKVVKLVRDLKPCQLLKKKADAKIPSVSSKIGKPSSSGGAASSKATSSNSEATSSTRPHDSDCKASNSLVCEPCDPPIGSRKRSKSTDGKSSDGLSNPCTFCWEREKRVMTVPCSHYCFCTTCAEKWVQTNGWTGYKWYKSLTKQSFCMMKLECPMCRLPIRELWKIFE